MAWDDEPEFRYPGGEQDAAKYPGLGAQGPWRAWEAVASEGFCPGFCPASAAQYLPAVLAIAYGRLGDVGKARDVAMAAILQAMGDRHALRGGPRSMARWACQLARDKARLRAPWPDPHPVKAWHRELLCLRAMGCSCAEIRSLLRLSRHRLNRDLYEARRSLRSAIMAGKEIFGGPRPCQSSTTRPLTSHPASDAAK